MHSAFGISTNSVICVQIRKIHTWILWDTLIKSAFTKPHVTRSAPAGPSPGLLRSWFQHRSLCGRAQSLVSQVANTVQKGNGGREAGLYIIYLNTHLLNSSSYLVMFACSLKSVNGQGSRRVLHDIKITSVLRWLKKVKQLLVKFRYLDIYEIDHQSDKKSI